MNTRDPLGRILVVDDEVQVNELLRDFMSGLGYIVKNAVSGREALRLAEVFQPDVVVLDLMPTMNGGEVLDRLRADHPSTRIIMLSANQDAALARSTLARGAFDYLPKPIDFSVLERVVSAAVAAGPRPG